ncbi:MAG: hypothetical protein ABIR92_05505 [Gemmatimonadaceae bacterium]
MIKKSQFIRALFLAAGILVCPASQAMSQPPLTLGTLHSGDTIRVWAVAPRLNGVTGVFARFGADTLAFGDLQSGSAEQALRAEVPYLSLRRIDVRRGLHRSGTRTLVGVVAGGMVGLLVGGALGPLVECSGGCSGSGDFQGLVGFVVGSGLGMVVGGVTGGVLGARTRPKWQAVLLTR